MNKEAIKYLLFKMADDALILGHRNSEWTGLGPMLEEDIAFSSMAQDKLGHALALYNILHEELGEANPDILGFQRKVDDFRCCHLVELPNGEYDFSLVRHFFYDHAEVLRYEVLESSSFEPIKGLANKIHGELKYHVLHANTWIRKLGHGSEEGHNRIQNSIDKFFHIALGMFEENDLDKVLISNKIYPSEKELRQSWIKKITPILSEAGFELPKIDEKKVCNGGRAGNHTPHLQPLLEEMTEVNQLDPSAEW